MIRSDAARSHVLLASAFLATFAGSLFWTGFPVMLSLEFSGGVSLSGIYAFATLGSLVFSLLGGLLSDARDCRKISVFSQATSAVFVLAFLGPLGRAGETLVLLALPPFYFNLSLGAISESVWFLSSPGSGGFKLRLLNRASVLIVAKLSGFSLGPLLFSRSGTVGLVLCAAAFALVAVAQAALVLASSEGRPNVPPATSNPMSLRNWIDLLSTPGFAAAAFLTGLLSIPMNPVFVARMMKLGATAETSLFWALAGGAGLAGTAVLRKAEVRGAWSFLAVTAGMGALVLASFTTERPTAIALAGAGYVFGSMILSMRIQIAVGEASKAGNLGARFGLLGCLTDAGVFAGMVLGGGLPMERPYLASGAVCALLALRFVSLTTLFGRSGASGAQS